MTNTHTTSPAYKMARDKVRAEWGKKVREQVGDRIYRALISEAVLQMAMAQDESTPAENIIGVTRASYSEMIDEMIEVQP